MFKIGDKVQKRISKKQGIVKDIIRQGKQTRVLVDYGYTQKQNWIEQLEIINERRI